jgi:hypothetical protein
VSVFTWNDFGTGYSCISVLRDLPVTGVKLDLRFVYDLTIADSQANVLAQGLSGLVTGRHLTGIAEGVETQRQANLLCEKLTGSRSSNGCRMRWCAPRIRSRSWTWPLRRCSVGLRTASSKPRRRWSPLCGSTSGSGTSPHYVNWHCCGQRTRLTQALQLYRDEHDIEETGRLANGSSSR